ncbi:M13 family metallopeptidase [Planktothrix mougeotii LEGE 06226]|uniref:M13 family metallopeptidase n=2 Tax=Planktothrix mougeotii TaxID=54306 RepID=A0ABR9UIT3_9CYAN|nr:M13 family metallopeptidase [Planktothrix mougeotii LEGE 06226]
MDSSLSPKDDFYNFTVGNWLKNAVIPDDKSNIDSFSDAFDQNSQKIQKIMKEAAVKSATAPKGSIIQQVGDFYASGINTELINKLGISPIKPELAKIDAVSSKQELISLIAHQNLMGMPSFLYASVSPDMKQSDVNAFYLQSFLPLGKDFYLSPDYSQQRKTYLAYITKILELAGKTSDQARNEAQMILELETSLAKIMLTPTEQADINLTYNKMGLTELKAKTSNIDWDQYFATLALPNLKEIIVNDPKYIIAFDQLLGERSLNDWKTYLHWQLLNISAFALSQDFAQANFDFSKKTLQGIQKPQSRDQEIGEMVRTMLDHPTAQLFVEQYFPSATKAKAEEMVQDIKAEFKIRLENNPWMSEATRQQALNKLANMNIYVGYPEKWIDYSAVSIDRDDYFGNLMRLNQWQIRRNLDTLGQPVKPELFTGLSRPTEVNAGYNMENNRIEIPAGILQPPFFDANLDDAVNYCTIGAVIAHEFTHGFDSRGRLFDPNGNLKDWWTPEDAQKFEAKANQLVEQYNKYEALPGLFVNGKLSLTENIADLGGITIAFSALQRQLTDQQQSTKIDGYTPNQRCFMAWGQMWKSKWRPEMLRQTVLTDPHPPSQFRVTGPVVNVPEFFTTFNIKKGDPLWRDPEELTIIW